MNRVKEVGDLCVKYAKSKSVAFTYKNKALSHEEVFAAFGVLPGIVKRASKISSVCTASSFAAKYPKKDRSYLGYEVVMDEPFSVQFLMLFVIDVLELVIGSSPAGSTVALDEFAFE